MNQTKAKVYVLFKEKSVFANNLVETINVTTKFVVTAVETNFVITVIVTTKLAVIFINCFMFANTG